MRNPSKLSPPFTTTNTLPPTTSKVITLKTTTTITATAIVTTTKAATTTSPWHSPIPYLFGGLAIIMALIAIALFILACSYWKLTRNSLNNNNNNDNNNVVKEGDDGSQNKEHPKAYEEKILVIMAGDNKPTFLATPSSSYGHSAYFNNKHLPVSEACDRSQKEISNDHVAVLDSISHA
ncbi:hypothetical protein VNO78_29094 [Psophocarpus tetragonolobus]|uniref:Uncharacterized protein n=1 Tax=Psophocarpus tetragonolobus TaxID=3891 RepID=A0AAN9X0G1_PSOTE